MALSKNLEELLKHMSAEDAAAQRKIWEEKPSAAEQVDKFFVPQAEFSRQLNLKDEEIKKEKKRADDWSDWAGKNKPKHEALLTDYEKSQAKIKELSDQLAAKVENQGGELDADQLAAKVEARIAGKAVTTDQVKAIMLEEGGKLINERLETVRKDFMEKTFPMTTRFQADLLDVMGDYRQETGKKLDRAEFSKFMEENNEPDPIKAFEKYMAPIRNEKKIEEEVDKRIKDKLSKSEIPGVSSGTGGERGVMELKIAGKVPKVEEGSHLGDLSGAAAAAAELRAEGIA